MSVYARCGLKSIRERFGCAPIECTCVLRTQHVYFNKSEITVYAGDVNIPADNISSLDTSGGGRKWLWGGGVRYKAISL
jgi:hypothetical protein